MKFSCSTWIFNTGKWRAWVHSEYFISELRYTSTLTKKLSHCCSLLCVGAAMSFSWVFAFGTRIYNRWVTWHTNIFIHKNHSPKNLDITKISKTYIFGLSSDLKLLYTWIWDKQYIHQYTFIPKFTSLYNIGFHIWTEPKFAPSRTPGW